MAQTIATGISAFAATNIDDLFVLLLFFSQVNQNEVDRIRVRCRSIVLGQYLGFTVLVVISLLGFLGRLVIPTDWLRWLGLFPIAIGLASLWSAATETENPPSPATLAELPNASRNKSWWHFGRDRTAEVAVVTIANGSDNLSIYIPLFANQTIDELIGLIAIFYGMIALWCGMAAWLTQRTHAAKFLHQYGAVLVPWTLIAIGLHIMGDLG
jgi:cadmium resistance protein CadD (predicted permease)